MTYRILVTGSRGWDRPEKIAFELGRAIGEARVPIADIVIVHGACPSGADKIAETIAAGYGIKTEPHPADWDFWGKGAGHIRNGHMVRAGANVCLAFIKDESPGATNCASQAHHAGITVRRFT